MDEIRASLRTSSTEGLPRGATGYHRWDIKWTYRYARAEVYCELSEIAIELNSTMTLREETGRRGGSVEQVINLQDPAHGGA